MYPTEKEWIASWYNMGHICSPLLWFAIKLASLVGTAPWTHSAQCEHWPRQERNMFETFKISLDANKPKEFLIYNVGWLVGRYSNAGKAQWRKVGQTTTSQLASSTSWNISRKLYQTTSAHSFLMKAWQIFAEVRFKRQGKPFEIARKLEISWSFEFPFVRIQIQKAKQGNLLTWDGHFSGNIWCCGPPPGNKQNIKNHQVTQKIKKHYQAIQKIKKLKTTG